MYLMFHGWFPPSLRLLFGKAFILLSVVFVGFLQPRRSSGRNLSLSVYIVFVSKAIICNLPSPTNPREPILLKTYIAEACAAFLFPWKTDNSITSDLGDGDQAKAIPNALETKPQQPQPGNLASHVPLRGQTSQGFQIAEVLQL